MEELLKLINSSQNIALVGHIRPDGDAIGSLLALSAGLRQMGKVADPIVLDDFPEAFSFLNRDDIVVNHFEPDRGYDLLIAIDVSDSARTGLEAVVKQFAKKKQFALIDHHMKGDLLNMAAASLYDPSASSVSELVFQLITQLPIKITPAIATALLAGVYTDTGGFQFANTNKQTLETAAELMRQGAKLKKIIDSIAQSKSVAALKLLGLAMKRVKLRYNGVLALSLLSNDDIAAVNGTDEDLSGLASQFTKLPEPQFSLLLTEKDQSCVRGSLRTNDHKRYDVSRLAILLGGGGHPRAAGFSLPGTLVKKGEGWQIIA